jgi:hypothetical protein
LETKGISEDREKKKSVLNRGGGNRNIWHAADEHGLTETISIVSAVCGASSFVALDWSNLHVSYKRFFFVAQKLLLLPCLLLPVLFIFFILILF